MTLGECDNLLCFVTNWLLQKALFSCIYSQTHRVGKSKSSAYAFFGKLLVCKIVSAVWYLTQARVDM